MNNYIIDTSGGAVEFLETEFFFFFLDLLHSFAKPIKSSTRVFNVIK